MRGLELERLAQARFALGLPADAAQRDPEVGVDIAALRMQRQGLRVCLDRGLELARSHQRVSHARPGVGEVRGKLHGSLTSVQRFGRAFLRVQRPAEVDPGRDEPGIELDRAPACVLAFGVAARIAQRIAEIAPYRREARIGGDRLAVGRHLLVDGALGAQQPAQIAPGLRVARLVFQGAAIRRLRSFHSVKTGQRCAEVEPGGRIAGLDLERALGGGACVRVAALLAQALRQRNELARIGGHASGYYFGQPG